MLWIDAWGEALRNPMMRTISQELDEHSTQLVVRVLEHGVATEEVPMAPIRPGRPCWILRADRRSRRAVRRP